MVRSLPAVRTARSCLRRQSFKRKGNEAYQKEEG
ncbi:hypothetical protein ZOSMA_84G00660 [Zostera marina]|uniref:Uncharacterized protein n=1 Tax=Zostera marina TaxID=29655 RepID=A0A0K9NNJ2_ZOSMR|nr:hypothetical protein ZOSMA_84G00660 [Zostera marina]